MAEIESWNRGAEWLRQLSEIDNYLSEAHVNERLLTDQRGFGMVNLLRTKNQKLSGFLPADKYSKLREQLTTLQKNSHLAIHGSKNRVMDQKAKNRLYRDCLYEAEEIDAEMNRLTKGLGFDFKLMPDPGNAVLDG